MDKIEGKMIIGVAGEGQTLRRAIMETEEVNRKAVETANPQVKKSAAEFAQTHRMINGEMHYLTVAGEWKPMLYAGSKGGKTTNE